MTKTVSRFLMVGLILGLGASLPARAERLIQFVLGGSATVLDDHYWDTTWFQAGPLLRVDLNLGRSFILAPELSGGIGGYSAGGTANLRLGRFFLGAGWLSVGTKYDGREGDWGTHGFLKAHAGIKTSRSLFAVSFVTFGYVKGWGLTFARVF